MKQLFQDAFSAIWEGRAENDEFNRLVIGGKLSWREVTLLRALCCCSCAVAGGDFVQDVEYAHLRLLSVCLRLFIVNETPLFSLLKHAPRPLVHCNRLSPVPRDQLK